VRQKRFMHKVTAPRFGFWQSDPHVCANINKPANIMSQISWNLKLSINDGKMDDFRSLMNEMVASTRDEAGCVTYDWFVMDDGSEVHIQERYADADATMVHIGNFGANYAERFFECVTPRSFVIYGPASDAIREALGPMGAVFMGHFGGFHR